MPLRLERLVKTAMPLASSWSLVGVGVAAVRAAVVPVGLAREAK